LKLGICQCGYEDGGWIEQTNSLKKKIKENKESNKKLSSYGETCRSFIFI